jgi:hypothetical protein
VAPPPALHRAPARQMRAAWPWAIVYRTRPTLACPYKIGHILFVLSTATTMGIAPKFIVACAEEGGKEAEGGRGWNQSRRR